MTNKQFAKKLREVTADLRTAIITEATRLSKSGAIDIAAAGDDYRAAKSCLYVALRNVAVQYMPLSQDRRKEIRNLERF